MSDDILLKRPMPPIIISTPFSLALPDTDISNQALLTLLREKSGDGAVYGEPSDATPDERFRVRTLMALVQLPEATRRFSRLGAKYPALAGGSGFFKTFAVFLISVLGFPLLIPSAIGAVAGFFAMGLFLFASIHFGRGSPEDVEMRAALRRMRDSSPLSSELHGLICGLNGRIRGPIPRLLSQFAHRLISEARAREGDESYLNEPDLKTDVRLASSLSGADLFALMRLRDRLRVALSVAGRETVVDDLDGETQELLHRAIEATDCVSPPKQLRI